MYFNVLLITSYRIYLHDRLLFLMLQTTWMKTKDEYTNNVSQFKKKNFFNHDLIALVKEIKNN